MSSKGFEDEFQMEIKINCQMIEFFCYTKSNIFYNNVIEQNFIE